MMNIESLILKSFTNFVLSNELVEENSVELSIDDAVGSYVVNIIRQFYSENQLILEYDRLEGESDIDSFRDIIDAYIPGFAQMKQSLICKWLKSLKKEIDEFKVEPVNKSEEINEPCEKFSTPNSEKREQKESNFEIQMLTEMFPNFNTREINDALIKFNNDKPKAIEYLLLNLKKINKKSTHQINDITEEDKKLIKEKTLQKFGLVQVNEDGSPIEVKPRFVWNEEKKLCRYYENKIVSTKGEKLFEYKTEKDEELEKQMKKTYINLKPARKYRFH